MIQGTTLQGTKAKPVAMEGCLDKPLTTRSWQLSLTDGLSASGIVHKRVAQLRKLLEEMVEGGLDKVLHHALLTLVVDRWFGCGSVLRG